VQDDANLAWKLAMVLRGHARETLLDSYEAERLPVGQLTVEQAYARYIRRVVPEEIGPDTPEMRDELTMELGQFYRSEAVIGGPEPNEPACAHPDATRGHPGSRVPHTWLGGDRSTIDCGADGLTLLAGPDGEGWDAAAEACGLAIERLPPAAADHCGIGATGAMLARPDGFVAARTTGDADPLLTLRNWLARVAAR